MLPCTLWLSAGKGSLMHGVLQPLLSHIRMGPEPRILSYQELTVMPGLSPCMEIAFPVSDSVCSPLFCLRLCLSGPQVHHQISVFQTPRWGCVGQLPCSGYQPWGTNVHYWGGSCSVSSPCKLCCSIRCLTALFLWQLWYQDAAYRSAWTSIPGGWHCDDLCSPSWSWGPPWHWCVMFCLTLIKKITEQAAS